MPILRTALFSYDLGAIMDQADMCQYRDVVDHSRAYTTVTSVAQSLERAGSVAAEARGCRSFDR